ncbi:right-handed parallel beta-helix repeat-containing protein [Pontiella agarivorans]|uniref:GLAA-B beta-barrel domain-containing protein n=1 Tax=Pontiella agarivorans TaxID=3038953 RepID=A0ABU5N1E9_9BACT|nr:right-handed parallel beta-helix repeat-containing protein [Pontiella agarivorans]MDZ8120243.1 hypothetical protein [Pontiella agarivorans]
MRTFFGVGCLLVICAGSVLARTVNVEDHGIVPGQDVTFKVNQLLEELQGEKGVTLYFPKGRYEFKPENAIEKYRAVTNHDNSLKRIAFPLYGFEDFTLDGGESTFLFYGRICPVIVENSKNIMLKNFSIDWDTPFHHELTVVERDEKNNTFVAEVSPMKHGFKVQGGKLLLGHYGWEDELGQNIPYDPKTGAPYWDTRRYGLKYRGAKAANVGENRVRLQDATRLAPPLGAVLCAWGNSPNRLAQSIHLGNSLNTTIENVTVYAGGGMGLIAERCENIHLNKFVVTSAEGRTLSARADATHFLGCKGLIHVENCLLEHMGDDGINVHGAYVKVVEYMGDNTFLCEISHRQQKGLIFCEPGDKVMLTSRKNVQPLYESTVTATRILNESRFLMTVDMMPETYPEGPLSFENLTWYPDVIMKKCIVRENRARSVLISTKGKVLLEDNWFSSQMHGVLIEGDNKSWYESGGVRDVTINNNTFVNHGYGNGQGYPLYAAPMLLPEQTLGDDQYHWNIRFTNNRIKNFNGHLVHAKSVKNLIVEENTVEVDNTYPSSSGLPAVALDFCKDVRVKNNSFAGFEFPIRIESKGGTTGLKVEHNTGLDSGTLNK